jgi:CSLREA domain-containing protein
MKRFATTAGAVLLLGGGLALGACVTPGSIVVTTTADTVADDGETSLREAFALANQSDSANTIVLARGATYDLTNCGAGPLAHTTASSLTLSGHGATVHQTCANSGIMRSTQTASSLIIDRTTVVGGPNSGATVYGAGINVRGSLELRVASVTGVDAGPGGTVVEGNTGGPADVDISLIGDYTPTGRSTITGNTGTAIRLRNGRVAGDWATIADNAGDGLRLDGTSSFGFFNTSISDHTGWGIRSTGAGRSTGSFEGGGIDRNGQGGVTCTGCSRLLINGSIGDNGATAAPGSGGGIEFLVDQDDPSDAPVLDIQYSWIHGNRARRAGGGVFVGIAESSAPTAPRTTVTIYGGTVEGNVTLGDDQPGGGVAVTSGNLNIVEFSNVDDNVAGGDSDGGGVYFQESPDDRVTEPYYFNIVESTVDRNRAGGSGGAVYVDSAGVQFFQGGPHFEGNSAGRDGGAAYVVYRGEVPGYSWISGTFVDNVAGERGGGAYAETDSVGGHFKGNRAAEGGGVFVSGVGPALTTGVRGTFEANTASVRGGGVAAERSNGFSLSATVTGNAAPLGGGVWIEGSPIGAPAPAQLYRSTIVENSAPVGSGVAVTGGELRTSASLIALPLGGGANCAADPADLVPAGWSFVSDTSCGVHPTDTVSTEDPQLLPLAPDPYDPYPGGPPERAPAWTSPVGGLIPVEVCDPENQGYIRGAGCEPGVVEIWEAVRIDGTSGADALVGTEGRDLVRGFEGDDVLRGQDNDDQLEGGPGHDWLLGGPGVDVLIGGDGDDVLIAGEGDDTFDGGPGNDLCLPVGALEPIAC